MKSNLGTAGVDNASDLFREEEAKTSSVHIVVKVG